MEPPRYEHDCTSCVFLGVFGNYDLYYCPTSKPWGSVIARDGNEGSQYISMAPKHVRKLLIDNDVPNGELLVSEVPLVICYARAIHKGLIKI